MGRKAIWDGLYRFLSLDESAALVWRQRISCVNQCLPLLHGLNSRLKFTHFEVTRYLFYEAFDGSVPPSTTQDLNKKRITHDKAKGARSNSSRLIALPIRFRKKDGKATTATAFSP
jgi:hypothetical protein